MQLCFDFSTRSMPPVPTCAEQTKKQKGLMAYQSGQAAEDIVARTYERQGKRAAARRWRGGGAEIDLIFRDGATLVFVEVKKSTTFETAVQRISQKQMQRIHQAATAFVANEPMGQLTDMRFDVALVDGQGRTKILENAMLAA